jgi:hypothetical protein
MSVATSETNSDPRQPTLFEKKKKKKKNPWLAQWHHARRRDSRAGSAQGRLGCDPASPPRRFVRSLSFSQMRSSSSPMARRRSRCS